MGAFQIVLSNFGLSNVKPIFYRAGLGETPPAGAANEYPVQVGKDVGNMTGEGWDAAPKSWMGLPVFADVRFPMPGNRPDINLQTVLVEVSQRKQIVTTAVQGRNGTVKEYIADGDYEVRIRGAIVTGAGADNYPYQDVRDLHELLSRSEAVEVVADYLRLFNIYSLVVTGYSFPQTEGLQNTQLFEIEAVSDLPEELIEEDL